MLEFGHQCVCDTANYSNKIESVPTVFEIILTMKYFCITLNLDQGDKKITLTPNAMIFNMASTVNTAVNEAFIYCNTFLYPSDAPSY